LRRSPATAILAVVRTDTSLFLYDNDITDVTPTIAVILTSNYWRVYCSPRDASAARVAGSDISRVDWRRQAPTLPVGIRSPVIAGFGRMGRERYAD
jgi:hypothetical protein